MRQIAITRSLIMIGAAIGALCLTQVGCTVLEPKADNTKLYVLRSQPTDGAPTSNLKKPALIVRVGPGRVAGYLDVNPIVIQDGANQVKQLDLHRWAEPLPKGISRVFSEDLTHRMGAQVVIYPEPANDANREVRYTISQLDGALDGPIKMNINWQIVELPSGKTLHTGYTTSEVAPSKHAPGVAGYVERMSAAIGIWADETAAAIAAQ